MSRATTWIERAGIPAVAVACKGFASSVELVSRAEGLPGVRMLEYPPPNMGVQSREEIHEYASGLVDELVALLTRPVKGARRGKAAASGTGIVFSGTIDQVNEHFRRKVWTDGLPIMPPTPAAVEAMLRFTDLDRNAVIGALPPKRLAATVWSVAVNGVMAGCRPEYMPVLLAVAEAVADPRFGLQDAGSTAGWTPLILLNGPIAKQLGFNSGSGVLRPQAQANISVSRFLRLLMMNVAGYRVGESDMATFGRNYYPVVAENEDESPWQPLSVDRGFEAGANVVTVQSADTTSHSFLTEGDAESQLQLIADELARELGGPLLTPMERFGGEVSPVLGLTPLIAGIIAKGGYSKAEAKKYLFEHALIPARVFEKRLARREPGYTLKAAVARGALPARFAQSDDPKRLVPVLHRPEELMIVVTGGPTRNRSFIAGQLGYQGLNVSKRIRLPAAWEKLLATSSLPSSSSSSSAPGA